MGVYNERRSANFPKCINNKLAKHFQWKRNTNSSSSNDIGSNQPLRICILMGFMGRIPIFRLKWTIRPLLSCRQHGQSSDLKIGIGAIFATEATVHASIKTMPFWHIEITYRMILGIWICRPTNGFMISYAFVLEDCILCHWHDSTIKV